MKYYIEASALDLRQKNTCVYMTSMRRYLQV